MTQEHDLYQHVKRPEWGLSAIVALDDDRTTFLFVDGTQRTIKRDHIHLMERLLVLDEAAEEAQRKLASFTRTRAGGAAKAKRAPKKKKPAAAAKPAASTPPS